jgi:hypothetical protein
MAAREDESDRLCLGKHQANCIDQLTDPFSLYESSAEKYNRRLPVSAFRLRRNFNLRLGEAVRWNASVACGCDPYQKTGRHCSTSASSDGFGWMPPCRSKPGCGKYLSICAVRQIELRRDPFEPTCPSGLRARSWGK